MLYMVTETIHVHVCILQTLQIASASTECLQMHITSMNMSAWYEACAMCTPLS